MFKKIFPILFILLVFFSFCAVAQHDHSMMANMVDLIPKNTATHVAVKNGLWFTPSTWENNEIPGEGAIVHIPENYTVTYTGASTAHIFAIRVDGTFICEQKEASQTTSLILDTFFSTMNSLVQFKANEVADGKINITIAPFDIETHKINTTNWNTEARAYYSDGATTYQVVRENEGGQRYKTYEDAIADNTTKMVEKSRTAIDDGSGVLGRHEWDATQLSLGIIAMGQLEILGQEKTNMVKLGADSLRGQRNVSLSQMPVGWLADDHIVITRGGNLNAASNGEDEVQIASISGTSITTTTNLRKNHEGRPEDNLHCYVGNLTRNITFTSLVTDEISKRGHLMAMHNDTNVQIKDAAFIDMGRTDKSRMTDDRYWMKWIKPKVFKSFASPLGQECAEMMNAAKDEISNHRGRYSIHLHKTGAKLGANMVQVTGNVVWGNPGWGITHHDSHANVSENVVYDVIGAGIVSETGSETGFWDNNLVVKIDAGSTESPYIAALFHDDYLYSGQGLAMKGRAVVCRGNVIANAKMGVGVINMNPTINSVDRVDAKQLATVRPGFEIDQFPLSVNGYSSEGDGILPVEVALIMENTTVIGCNQGLRSIERDMGVNHESRSVFDGFYAWGINQGLSITYQADYTFHDVFLSGKNTEAIGAYLWKHSHNHVFEKIKMVDLAHGITVSKLVESGNGLLKTRNNGFSPWYFIDLTTQNVTDFYEIAKEDETTATTYLEHSDNPIHLNSNSEVFERPTTFTIGDDADLAVDYQNSDFNFAIDGIISDDLGTYKLGIEQALAQKDLRNDYPARLYEFASKAKFDEYIMANGVYQHPTEDYKYFIINEVLPNRLSSKYTSFPVRIKIENAPESGLFANPTVEPLVNFSQKQLVSLAAVVNQSSTASTISYDNEPIDCAAEKAVDGNTNGRINAQIFQRGLVPLGSFSQTNEENDPWYDLDLGELKDINSIDIWNTVSLSGTSIETPSADLTDFYVMIDDEPFGDKTLDESLTAAIEKYHITQAGLRRFALNNIDTKGRYIRIQMRGFKALRLAEVEVVGSSDLCLIDETPPMVQTKDITVYIDENGIAEITTEAINDTSTDDCGIASLEIDKTTFTCADTGENIVTLTATDNLGNAASAAATVTVLSAMPILSCPVEPLEIAENPDGTLQLPDFNAFVEDDCTYSLSHTLSDDHTNETATGSITITVVDESNNEVSCSFDIISIPNAEMNDGDGSEEMENTPEEEVLITLEDIKVSPNPTFDIVRVHAAQHEVDRIELFDMRGRLVKFRNFNTDNYEIDLLELETGSYFLKIYIANQTIIRRVLKK